MSLTGGRIGTGKRDIAGHFSASNIDSIHAPYINFESSGWSGDALLSLEGRTFDTCDVRDDVKAQIVATGTIAGTYKVQIRCFDTSGGTPVPGNLYRLTTTTNAAILQSVSICWMEDNKLCAYYTDWTGANIYTGIRIINIEPNGLDVDSVGTWYEIPVQTTYWSLGVVKSRTNQVTTLRHRGSIGGGYPTYAKAFTFVGDNVDSEGNDYVIHATDFYQKQGIGFVRKEDGKSFYAAQMNLGGADSMRFGRLNTAVDNTVSEDYSQDFPPVASTRLHHGLQAEYSSTLDLFTVSALSSGVTNDGVLYLVADTGSGFTRSSIAEWLDIGGVSAPHFHSNFDNTGNAMSLTVDANDSDKIKFDTITITGSTPTFDEEIQLVSDTGAGVAMQQTLYTTDGKLLFIWWYSDSGVNYTGIRFWIK